jgi:hypothetical protein
MNMFEKEKQQHQPHARGGARIEWWFQTLAAMAAPIALASVVVAIGDGVFDEITVVVKPEMAVKGTDGWCRGDRCSDSNKWPCAWFACLYPNTNPFTIRRENSSTHDAYYNY